MKVLFVAGASSATLFALTPLALALRNEGHDVIMTSTEEMVPVAEKTGVPFVTVTDRTIESLLSTDRAGDPVPRPQDLLQEQRFAGSWFGRLAAASIDRLRRLAEYWHPDLVVGGTSCYAASLLSAQLGIPHVRHAWDALDASATHQYADEELAPELAALGLEKLPAPDLFIDICPPSIRSSSALTATMMRWIPGNLQQELQPWMLTRGDRPRVCVTSGSRVAVTKNEEFLRSLAEELTVLDAEILVAAPEDVAPGLRERLPEMRIGWMPLDILAPTCDLIVHHGGGVTSMTAMNYGVPQLVLPSFTVFADSWKRLERYGASNTLMPGEQTAENVAKRGHELLTTRSYRDRAVELSQEMADLPGPAEQVAILVDLATG